MSARHVVRKLTLAASVALLALAPAAQAAFPGPNGKISFSDDSAGADIWTMNPNGTGLDQLTDTFAHDADSAWSPDGTRIAYSRDDALYVMDADGRHQRQVVGIHTTASPSWSPDGTKIFYEHLGQAQIWTVNADAGAPTMIATSAFGPALSPNGDKIAFSWDGIGVMNADGSGRTMIVTGGCCYYKPAWSPDGTKIAFSTTADGPEKIFVVNADGTGLTRITDGPGDFEPAWSPDGAKIVYVTSRDPEFFGFELHVMDADGANDQRLTTTPNDERYPDWGRIVNYPKPAVAARIRVPLMPTYEQCTAPNTTHAEPLDFPSCTPQAEESSVLTMSDLGFALDYAIVEAIGGNPATSADEADLRIIIRLRDVRCRTAAPPGCAAPNGDFAGSLLLRSGVRLTDRDSLRGSAATAVDTTLDVPIPCSPTASDPGRGSVCAVATTADTLYPDGFVREGKGTVMQTLSFLVLDPGPNGTGFGAGCPPTCGDGDETEYLRQGAFFGT